MNALADFETERGRLQAVAYGMLGSVADAEDIVQEAYIRWQQTDTGAVETPAAWLTTIVTRLSINRLQSAQRRRETYPGPWLPEPIITEADPAHVASQAERLSLALLATLERLNPVERAVLLLRDVFDLDYADIAQVVGRSEPNCRQIARRARDRVSDPTRRFRPSAQEEHALVTAFTAAVDAGDIETLTRILAADVVMWSDGGGKVAAARQPIHGAQNVARFLIGIATKAADDLAVTHVHANGDPAFLIQSNGETIGVIALEPADAQILAVRYLANPDKLRHLNT